LLVPQLAVSEEINIDEARWDDYFIEPTAGLSKEDMLLIPAGAPLLMKHNLPTVRLCDLESIRPGPAQNWVIC
jgi:hypothetical protein